MDHAPILISLGALLLASIGVDALARRTGLPRVSLLILLGIAAGPILLDVLPADLVETSELITKMALVMVAFLLGGELSLARLRRYGKAIVLISISVVAVTTLIVGGGLILIGVPVTAALMLAGIATATDPAAAQDVVRESGSGSAFSKLLLGIVAIDDGWGIIVFAIMLSIAALFTGADGNGALYIALHDVGGAILLGLVVGTAAAFLTGHVRAGEPLLSEAIGVVFLCGGLALWLEVSYLLAPMVAGIMVANLAAHHKRAFREIEHVEWPFLVLFFVLAGASLDLHHAARGGIAIVAYIVLRIAGRLAGGWLGGRMAGLAENQNRTIGLGLLPQAGIALGMALAAGAAHPPVADLVLAVTIGTTIFFEIFGPLVTRRVILFHEKNRSEKT